MLEAYHRLDVVAFVRLGRGFNAFIEPGRSIVVKCGRVTEVEVEPGR